MKKTTAVLAVAPVHRNWGNRVVREVELLAREGYDVTALMRCAEDASERNGVTYLAAPQSNGRLGRFMRLPAVLWRVVRFKADIYHLHNPDTLPIALMLRLLGRCVVYDTHEDYSRRLQLRMWIPRWLRSPLGFLVSSAERLVSHLANATLVTQEGQLPRFASRTRLLRNAPDLPLDRLRHIREQAMAIPRISDTFYALYVGGVSEARGVFVMLDALEVLNQQGLNTRLWLVGPELDGCLDRARAHSAWRYVDYRGLLPHDEALGYMTRADVGLVVLSDTGDHRWARPSKLFEYMACGLPFVASDFAPWREFVSGRGGVWVQPDCAPELSQMMASLLNDEAARTRLAAEGVAFIARFNWATEAQTLVDLYERLAQGKANA